MKKKLIVFDDAMAKELEQYPNMSEVVRKAVGLYIGHIQPDTVEGLRTGYKNILILLKEIDSKIDYIAEKL